MNFNLTLIGQTISMIVFVAIAMKIWPMLIAKIDERRKNIADGIAAGEKGQRELADARQGAEGILQEARQKATQVADLAHKRSGELIAEAKQVAITEGERLIASARTKLTTSQTKARDALRREVAALAEQTPLILVDMHAEAYTDRNTCVLFGDAAAAVLVEPSAEEGYGILDVIVRCDGSGRDALYMRAGGSLMPATHESVDKRLHYIYQDGKAVFKVAVVSMADVSAEIMERNHLTGKDVDWLVPHQANLRIIDATARRMGLDSSKVMINIDRYGNTTAATIPLCLSEWLQQGELRRGQRVVMASFGAGYTWGAILVRWSVQDAIGG